MTLRPSRPDDAPEVIRLASVMYESMGVDVTPPEWRREAERMVRGRAGTEGCAVFVVEDDEREGHLLACGAVTVATRLPGPGVPNARFGYIQWMATEPEHRRRGHARAIFDAILGWLRAQGVKAVELHATPEGESLYRSFGFEPPRHPQLRAGLEE